MNIVVYDKRQANDFHFHIAACIHVPVIFIRTGYGDNIYIDAFITDTNDYDLNALTHTHTNTSNEQQS